MSTCPNCGYCPHCGRSAAPVVSPWIQPQPYYSWIQPVWAGTTTGTVTVGWTYKPTTSVAAGGQMGTTYFTKC